MVEEERWEMLRMSERIMQSSEIGAGVQRLHGYRN